VEGWESTFNRSAIEEREMGMLRRRRIIAIVVCLLTLLALRDAGAQLIVKGDRAAYEKVRQAFEMLRTVRSYRMRSVSPRISPAVIINELVNPDRWRSLKPREGFAIETIRVGNEMRLRVIRKGRPEPWSCLKTPHPAAAPNIDPETATGQVEVTDLGAFKIGGISTRGYRYARTTSRGTAMRRIYLHIDTGRLRRQEILGSDGSLLTTFDYYDYNAPIRIELPKCGSVTPPS